MAGQKRRVRAGSERGTTLAERGVHTAGGGILKVTVEEEEAQVVAGEVPVFAGGATANAEAGGALTAAAALAPAETGVGVAVGGATAGEGVTGVRAAGVVAADTAGGGPGAAIKAKTTGVTVIRAEDTEDTAAAGIGATPDDVKLIRVVFY